MQKEKGDCGVFQAATRTVTGQPKQENGAGNRIRTDDPRITNALLYQLSYPGIPFTRKDLRNWKTVRFDFYTVGLYGHDPRIGERAYGNMDQSQ